MKTFFFQLLLFCSTLMGPWFFRGTARVIAAGYFFFSPRTKISNHFYKVLFPQATPLYHHWCTFLQYQNFTSIYFDRFLLSLNRQRQNITFTSNGLHYLNNINPATGAIILQSHLGNWDIAAHLLQQSVPELDLLLFMGMQEKRAIEQAQKNDLHNAGIRIIGVEKEGASPLEAVEGIHHLRNGGVVSMTGDLLWQQDQRTVEVDFLGNRATLPAAPYVFAILTGAPLLIFFTFQTGPSQYDFSLSRPLYVSSRSRATRQKDIAEAAQQYATMLEQALLAHPFEWYHFEPFIFPAS